jgi:hypothetical protein
MLNPATHDRFEVALGRAHTYLASCQHYSTVDGSIDPETGPDGLRQFRGAQLPNYWFAEGSSGSPVFLDKAEQLAGIISLSEIGGKQGVTRLREAFVVPATTIRKYLRGTWPWMHRQKKVASIPRSCSQSSPSSVRWMCPTIRSRNVLMHRSKIFSPRPRSRCRLRTTEPTSTWRSWPHAQSCVILTRRARLTFCKPSSTRRSRSARAVASRC